MLLDLCISFFCSFEDSQKMNYEHTKNLSEDFSDLLKNNKDYSVKINIGKKPNIREFKAHSIFLSSVFSIKDDAINLVDIFIAANELELLEVCQQIENTA